MYKPLDLNDELECKYMHPIEAKMRMKFLDIVKKHGNGKWAFEELEWLVYVDGIDEYEAMNEDDKWVLNIFMKAFRSLYK
jgi:hypothetical protein